MSSLSVAPATSVRRAVVSTMSTAVRSDSPRVTPQGALPPERVTDVVKPGRTGAVTVEYLVLHDIERFSMRRATRTETRQTAPL